MSEFSVLMSVYYRENSLYLHDALSSIFDQTITPSEVVLVKDGPLTDKLEKVIEQFVAVHPELKVISLSENIGLGKALNKGLEHCSYEIVARMDTDDIACKDRIEKQMKILETYSDIDVVGSWINEFEGRFTHVVSSRKVPETHEDIIRFAKKRCPLNHPTVMFKKRSVIAVGGYKHFPLFEDYYLWIRMLQNGARFYNCQESLLYFRASPEMFKRRGGISYALNEIKLQKEFKRIGFISTFEFCRNVAVRFISRIIPNNFRIYLYKNILRK